MSSSSSSAHDVTAASAQAKQAACLECRRSKVRCTRDVGAAVCRKCQQAGLQCVTPEYHVGRYKGVKNKRSGLEKAIYQVEQALKRSKDCPTGLTAETEADLRQLISAPKASPLLRRQSSTATPALGHQQSFPQQHVGLIPAESTGTTENGHEVSPADHGEKPDELALNNADNPLQLLAMASVLPGQSPSTAMSTSPAGVIPHPGANEANAYDDAELQQFFGSLLPRLDNSPEVDPINLGLVTQEEADSLFAYFYERLSHTRWGLDPVLHTAAFVRSRSAFLFTSILAASALFLPKAEALSKRLSNHRNILARKVVSDRNRSVEIVLAFMVNIPWMTPAKHWADDETCAYLSMALALALDLSLNKIVVPSPTIRPAGFLDRVAKAECIDSAKALQLDGFPHVDPLSVWGRRLLRTRERVWLALFVLDRGVCLARGRPYAVPIGPLVESCDTWHISDIADRWDGSVISAAVLRRDLVGLITSVREFCDGSQGISGGSTAVRFLKDKIDRFFEQWYAVWSRQITQGDGQLPPYVEILVSHTKLSTYCNVVNHPTASNDVKQFFRAAGLASATNVMRAAVQGENRLKSMPNNTVIMVSFAATFALALGATNLGNRAMLPPNAKALIEETTQVLERIGSSPRHRKGLSVLFARHIRRIMQSSLLDQPEENHTPLPGPSGQIPPHAHKVDYGNSQSNAPPAATAAPEPYVFDMTDDQILEAINNASTSQDLFQLDETMFFDWLDWPNVT
ncbi:Zn(II)2Cys6 transcription factor [Cladophialophora carrionii]|uniref:Zn(II)2Cys6 transcription factor n=1 Tax=Cladophialophora carrionii TaxID=86049 RepID=A0A1C1CSL5_9EURO|nr:Zn(II)2Cys6 transcription factor [Cladophialophora carrionii]